MFVNNVNRFNGLIEMSQMQVGLARLDHNLTHDEKQIVSKSYGKYKSSIDMLEKKCMCSQIVIGR